MIPVLDVKAGIEAENDIYAEEVRRFLKERNVFLVNLMASPGAGKTTLLSRVIDDLAGELEIGVIEADVDADVDAQTVAAHGARAVQVHTGGSCHMDARMTLTGLKGFGGDIPKVVFLENVGNLVCPAEFDVGANLRLMLLSVPEGDDKPLKYPLMFTVSDALAITKTDTAPAFDFNVEACTAHVRALGNQMPVFPLSVKTGEGWGPFIEWLKAVLKQDPCTAEGGTA